MAKVTITIKDNVDGTVGFEMTFKPTIKSDKPATPAQAVAIRMMESIRNVGEVSDEDDEGGA